MTSMKATAKQALTWSNGNEHISARQALTDRHLMRQFLTKRRGGSWRTYAWTRSEMAFAYEGATVSESFTTSVTDVEYGFAVVGITTTKYRW